MSEAGREDVGEVGAERIGDCLGADRVQECARKVGAERLGLVGLCRNEVMRA